jgi:hypothetical protein
MRCHGGALLYVISGYLASLAGRTRGTSSDRLFSIEIDDFQFVPYR